MMPPNEGMNLTDRPVTRLAGLSAERTSNGSAQGARPSHPAGSCRRYLHDCPPWHVCI